MLLALWQTAGRGPACAMVIVACCPLGKRSRILHCWHFAATLIRDACADALSLSGSVTAAAIFYCQGGLGILLCFTVDASLPLALSFFCS